MSDSVGSDGLFFPDSNQLAFLGAVHRLIRDGKSASKSDILVSSVMHALAGRSMTAGEVCERVEHIWPGQSSQLVDVEEALGLAKTLKLVACNEGLSGEQLWVLTESGSEDIERHRKWSKEVREAAATDLAERARESLTIELTTSQAELWLASLIDGLIAGIQQSQDAYLGNVEAIVGGKVRPKSIDRAAVLSRIKRSTGSADQEREAFLEALALAAIDPLDDFGNELVSHITTGCVLHSYVVGRDRSKVLKEVGSARGERVFLDTPCLLRLLGSTRLRHPLELTLKAAVEAGWDVQVLEHSVSELQDVLGRAIPELSSSFRRAIDAGAKETWFASLVDEQVPAIYVEAAREGLYRVPADFKEAADTLETRLSALGVTVRPAGNWNGAEKVARFAEALVAELGESKRRSLITVERDAETMAAAERRRSRQSSSKWPGCWVITNDRHMGPAYATATLDRVSLTLTPAQWSSLLAASADPPEVMHLAEAAAGQWIEEAMWSIPARFPSEIALELAAQLTPSQGGSSMSLRVAQLSLDEALDGDDGLNSAGIASTVLGRRATMLKTIMDRRTEQSSRVQASAEAERDRALRAANEARTASAEAAAQIAALRADVDRLTSAQLENESTLGWRRTQLRRVVATMVLLAIALATLAGGMLVRSEEASIAAIVALGLFGYSGYRWCTEPTSRFLGLILGGVVNLVGFASAALDLWQRGTG